MTATFVRTSSGTQIAVPTAPTQARLTNDGDTEAARSTRTTPWRRTRAAADNVAYASASARSEAGLGTRQAG
eukprot:3406392-Pleurochrysis_carterae.AAC.1